MAMLNEHLEHHVKQLILANEDLSSLEIAVSADDGVVTLSGSVQSFRRKLAAQEIVESDAKVARVINNLTVEPAQDSTDTMIALAVNQKFDTAADIEGESISVDAKTGTITLTGYVSTDLEKLRVADMAAAVDSVSRVTNLLIVNPDEVKANKEHVHEILESIRQIIGMEEEQIRLSVVNENARLSGYVDALWKKEKAETVVSQHGVLKIANQITVRGE
jgi:osmotically-inducible protein OsmY